MIDSFRESYYFLSNFYHARFYYNGHFYLNAEAAFQAQKCPDIAHRFENLNPREAKKMGRQVQLRSDWESVKDNIMYEVVLCKFSQNPALAHDLLATGTEELVEGNSWNDTYWGVCRGRGQNKLGKILMQIREELGHSEDPFGEVAL